MADPKNLLSKLAKKTPAKKSASKTPMVELRKEFSESFQKWHQGKDKEKEGEALRTQAEEVLMEEMMQERMKTCINDGKFHTSVKFVCSEAPPINLVVQNRYSEVPLDNEEPLRKVFSDNFDQYFTLVTKIEVSEQGMRQIEEILPKLVKAVGGEEVFGQLFAVKQHYKPTEKLHEGRASDQKLAGLAAEVIQQGLLNPAKPSFKK